MKKSTFCITVFLSCRSWSDVSKNGTDGYMEKMQELSEEERFCYNMSYFHIVQELFLFRTSHSGGTSTRAKCRQFGVDSSENVEFKFSEEEDG